MLEDALSAGITAVGGDAYAADTARVWVDGAPDTTWPRWTQTERTRPTGQVEHSIIEETGEGEGTLYLWYNNDREYRSYPADRWSADLSQRIPTYEDVLALERDSITDTGYEEKSGTPCIYVEVEDPELLYRQRYWVSVSDGLLVAAVSESIETLITALERARVRTAAVAFVPFGLARVAKVVAPPEETVAVIAIDAHTTNLVVAQDGVPRFARIIPLDLGLAADRDEQPPTPGEPVEEPLPAARRALSFSVPDTASPAVTDLIERIRNTLSFHASRSGATAVSTIFLTGPGIDLPGLVQQASAQLRAPVFTIDVTNVVALDKGAPALGSLAHNLVTTLGVLLGEEH